MLKEHIKSQVRKKKAKTIFHKAIIAFSSTMQY